jgi:rod shape-determining protein MreD
MSGQITGFFSGLMLDLFSSAPLGLNAIIYTIAGALAGLLRGTFILDVLFFPMLLCIGATVLKAVLLLGLHYCFLEIIPSYSLSTPTLFVELALNAFLAPIIFSFLNHFKILLKEAKSNASPKP